jgi:hypothetical protein
MSGNGSGGARDPALDPELVRRRREVLALLRGVGRDARGKGLTLSTGELTALLEPILGGKQDGKLVGQAARWFARARRKGEDETEWVLYCVNPDGGDWRDERCRWGMSKERGLTDVDVDRVLAAYDGRLAAIALARADETDANVDFEASIPANVGPHDVEAKLRGAVRDSVAAGMLYERDLADAPTSAPIARQRDLGLQMQNRPDDGDADADLAQFAAKDPEGDFVRQFQDQYDGNEAFKRGLLDAAAYETRFVEGGREPRDYDHARVAAAVELVRGAGPPDGAGWRALTTALWVATGREPREILYCDPAREVEAAVAALNAWERVNLLLGLAEWAVAGLSRAAATVRATARALDEAAEAMDADEA